MKGKTRVVLHSDLNNCFAGIECMLHPELKGKCIAVCGNTEDRHGIVLAKSREAKACGVTTGEVIWQAKQKCPDLQIVRPHMEQYQKYSKIVREIYLRYSSEVESFGLDECWIELTGSPRLKRQTPYAVADEIRQTVKRETGLTVSVGVSFNKIFAKLGSDMKKPDAVTEIREDTFREKIWPLEAGELLYVGRATQAKLKKYAIYTIGDLARTDPELLHRLFGINGEKLWLYANGLDNSRVMPCDYVVPVQSIGHGITCTEDLHENEEVFRVFKELSQSIGLKMRRQEVAAGGVRVAVRGKDLRFEEYRIQMPFPTQSYGELCEAGCELFARRYRWNQPVRALTITATSLVPADTPLQTDLWSDFYRHEKRLRMEKTVEEIRRRFGLHAINYASLIGNIKLPEHREVEYRMPAPMYQ